MTDKPVSLGEFLRSLREREHWSLAQAGERLGMSKSHLHQIEAGVRNPKWETLSRFIGVYSVTERQLWDFLMTQLPVTRDATYRPAALLEPEQPDIYADLAARTEGQDSAQAETIYRKLDELKGPQRDQAMRLSGELTRLEVEQRTIQQEIVRVRTEFANLLDGKTGGIRDETTGAS